MAANTTATPGQVTSLMSNEMLSRVERLRINATGKFTNRTRGEHLFSKGGSSTEFADYRDYTPGDDVRYVDWNIFSRLNRPYLKLYHHEEEMHIVILVDASASMRFEGKLELAKRVGAALGVMGLMGTERVSVYAFNQPNVTGLPFLPAAAGRGKMRRMFDFITAIGAAAPGKEGDADQSVAGAMPVEDGIETMLRRHRGRGVVVVVSDFMTFTSLTRAFNLLFSTGLEIFALQILAPSEIDPEVTGDLRMVDCETNFTLDVSAAGDLVAIYHEYRDRFQATLDLLARQRMGKFMSVSSTDPLEKIVLDLMRRKGWVKG